MYAAILHAAREMFPGRPWASVEKLLRKAWNGLALQQSWQEVRPRMQRDWNQDDGGGAAENQSATRDGNKGLTSSPNAT